MRNGDGTGWSCEACGRAGKAGADIEVRNQANVFFEGTILCCTDSCQPKTTNSQLRLVARRGLSFELHQLLEGAVGVLLAIEFSIDADQLVVVALQDERGGRAGEGALKPRRGFFVFSELGEAQAEIKIGGRWSGVCLVGVAQKRDSLLWVAGLDLNFSEIEESDGIVGMKREFGLIGAGGIERVASLLLLVGQGFV